MTVGDTATSASDWGGRDDEAPRQEEADSSWHPSHKPTDTRPRTDSTNGDRQPASRGSTRPTTPDADHGGDRDDASASAVGVAFDTRVDGRGSDAGGRSDDDDSPVPHVSHLVHGDLVDVSVYDTIELGGAFDPTASLAHQSGYSATTSSTGSDGGSSGVGGAETRRRRHSGSSGGSSAQRYPQHLLVDLPSDSEHAQGGDPHSPSQTRLRVGPWGIATELTTRERRESAAAASGMAATSAAEAALRATSPPAGAAIDRRRASPPRRGSGGPYSYSGDHGVVQVGAVRTSTSPPLRGLTTPTPPPPFELDASPPATATRRRRRARPSTANARLRTRGSEPDSGRKGRGSDADGGGDRDENAVTVSVTHVDGDVDYGELGGAAKAQQGPQQQRHVPAKGQSSRARPASAQEQRGADSDELRARATSIWDRVAAAKGRGTSPMVRLASGGGVAVKMQPRAVHTDPMTHAQTDAAPAVAALWSVRRIVTAPDSTGSTRARAYEPRASRRHRGHADADATGSARHESSVMSTDTAASVESRVAHAAARGTFPTRPPTGMLGAFRSGEWQDYVASGGDTRKYWSNVAAQHFGVGSVHGGHRGAHTRPTRPSSARSAGGRHVRSHGGGGDRHGGPGHGPGHGPGGRPWHRIPASRPVSAHAGGDALVGQPAAGPEGVA